MTEESLDHTKWIDVDKNIRAGHVKNDQGLSLYIKHIKSVGKNKKTLFFIHDVLDHHERYLNSLLMFQEVYGNNIEIFMLDIQGHGLSSGSRAHFQSMNQLSSDFLTVLRKLSIENDFFLWGHGLGAMVFLNLLLGKKIKENYGQLQYFKGLVASSFYYILERRLHPVAKLLEVVKRNPALSVDTVKVNRLIHGNDLSFDRKIAENYEADPLVVHRISYKVYKEIEETLDLLIKKAYFIDFPILILSGKSDELINHEKLSIFAKSIEKKYSSILELSDSKHDLYNDIDSKYILKEINQWMKSK